MIKMEHYKTRPDGVELMRVYSDRGLTIICDGKTYQDGIIDVADSGRSYTEGAEPAEKPRSAEIMEKAMAYDILMGVER